MYFYKEINQTNKDLIDAFTLALELQLHEKDGFALRGIMLECIEDLILDIPSPAKAKINKSIAIAFAFEDKDNTQPIGLCVKIGKQFCIYIKPEHRRKGIGSALLSLMRKLYGDTKCFGVEGIENSCCFFIKNRLSHESHTEKKFVIFEHFRLNKK
jgi:GNAT superfamily N-acetyltransferase